MGKIDLSLAEAAGAVLLGQSEERTFSVGQGGQQASVAPAHVQGSVAVKVARNERIHILNHKDCAAEDNAPVIGNGIITNTGPNGEDIYEAIKDHRFRDGHREPLKLSKFRQIQDAWAEAMAEGTIVNPDVSKPVHDEGDVAGGQELLPIARASLVPMPHYAHTHLIEWGTDMIYDREAALEASNFDEGGEAYGAYQTSMGSAGELHAAVASVFPVEREDLLEAMYVRNAATSLYLPRQLGPDVPTQLMAVGQ